MTDYNVAVSPLSFVLKVASRCNLNCEYCYVYNKGDLTWRDRPGLMPESVFQAAIKRIKSHCDLSKQQKVRLVFHGGEPCLLGASRFRDWCNYARRELAPREVKISIQTNGNSYR